MNLSSGALPELLATPTRRSGLADALLPAAGVAAGLLAGLYFAFAVAVMPALRSVDDRTFVHVMNKVNEVIVNPVFLLVFLGAPVLAAAVLLVQRLPSRSRALPSG